MQKLGQHTDTGKNIIVFLYLYNFLFQRTVKYILQNIIEIIEAVDRRGFEPRTSALQEQRSFTAQMLQHQRNR